jgi:hypothetical protein
MTVPVLHPQLSKIAHAIRVSTALEQLCGSAPDSATRMKCAEAKVVVDDEIFSMASFSVKTAAAEHPMRKSASQMAELAISLHGLTKIAAHAEKPTLLADAVTKMATVGAIDGLLGMLPSTLSPEATKLACELRAINRGYGVALLAQVTN